ncbi:MAG: AtpZ/AtpI family protein [Candidatus Nomurabacteria bacterium]|nr:MAG: AtpZ/AtpI family protein [Candidatus Nomurabacteria bacterium]
MSAAAAKKSDDKPTPPEKSTVILLFATAADTTWRMFLPTLGGTGIGLWLDGQFKTEPWYGIGGLTIGIVVTAFLIRQQYVKAAKDV